MALCRPTERPVYRKSLEPHCMVGLHSLTSARPTTARCPLRCDKYVRTFGCLIFLLCPRLWQTVLKTRNGLLLLSGPFPEYIPGSNTNLQHSPMAGGWCTVLIGVVPPVVNYCIYTKRSQTYICIKGCNLLTCGVLSNSGHEPNLRSLVFCQEWLQDKIASYSRPISPKMRYPHAVFITVSCTAWYWFNVFMQSNLNAQ